MITTKVEIRHAHLFCGLGGGASGFNRGQAKVGTMEAKFRCIGGIDVDPAAIADFGRLAGVPGTVMDLFDRDQYISWHGKEPPAGWREMLPADILRALGNETPHIWFLSAPCKGFSGLLSESRSLSQKYQALNRLTLRGIWLALEACKDNPAELIVFENVPRIATRGRPLLDQIIQLLQNYGYATAETTHDCGRIGNLAQSRKRFLLVARHMLKVPPFLYEPPQRPLRAVGEILGRMPRPGDPVAGPMHRMPALQWKTWVRLAFVEAGSDWRSLNKLAVEDGVLRDYLLIPEYHRGYLGVMNWDEHSGTITGRSTPSTGKFSVADPSYEGHAFGQWGVRKWGEPAGVVTGQQSPGQGPISVADPIFDPGRYDSVQYGVRRWDQAVGVVTSQRSPSQGAFSVADPRVGLNGNKPYNHVYRIIRWDKTAPTVISANAGTAAAVADPGFDWKNAHENKMRVQRYDEHSRAVTGSQQVGSGGLSIADPLPPPGPQFNKYTVTPYDKYAGTVIAGAVNGAFAVADPLPGFDRSNGDFLTGGHYGVLPWTSSSFAVTGSARQDNGPWSVADPHIPAATDRLVAVIRALDGTWHRPLTTLELAALQSLVDPEECWSTDPQTQGEIDQFRAALMPFKLEGESDSAWRERIGNAVPRDAAEAIASTMGTTLLLAWTGETFLLSAQEIWVRDIAVALSVRPA